MRCDWPKRLSSILGNRWRGRRWRFNTWVIFQISCYGLRHVLYSPTVQWREASYSHVVEVLLNLVKLATRLKVLPLLLSHICSTYWVDSINKWSLRPSYLFGLLDNFFLTSNVIVSFENCLLFETTWCQWWILKMHVTMKLFIFIDLVKWMTPR